MYQISCDGLILHDVRLDKQYRVLDPSCNMEVNAAGNLTFRVPPFHPYYDRIHKLSSRITLTQDGEWVFSGRVLNDQRDFRNIKTVEVEGDLSFLSDSNQRKEKFQNISVKDYFTKLIEKHNAMVEPEKRFTVGSVTVTDPNDSLYRMSNYETTMDTISDKLISRLGGYVRIRRSGGTQYIDYISDYENVNTQEINFGKNMLNFTEYVKGEDVATAIIPLGARITSKAQPAAEGQGEDDDSRITIESVTSDGKDYVFDQEAVNLYGWVFQTIVWDDVTLPENLLRKAQQELGKRRLLNFRLELNAIDLHLLDVNIERIKLGDKIRVVSSPHGIDKIMQVTKLTIDIDNPENNTITLGFTGSSLTDLTNKDGIKKEVAESIDDLGIKQDINTIKHEVRQTSSELSRTHDNILLAVSESYASKSDLEALSQSYSTQLEVQSDSVEMRFNTLKSKTEEIDGVITSNQELLEEYIRFKGALIELGRIGNVFVTRLSNERLSFLQDNIEIAYVSNNKLYITDAEIRNKLTIGNPTNGYFDFIPRSNGNLSLKWRAN